VKRVLVCCGKAISPPRYRTPRMATCAGCKPYPVKGANLRGSSAAMRSADRWPYLASHLTGGRRAQNSAYHPSWGLFCFFGNDL